MLPRRSIICRNPLGSPSSGSRRLSTRPGNMRLPPLPSENINFSEVIRWLLQCVLIIVIFASTGLYRCGNYAAQCWTKRISDAELRKSQATLSSANQQIVRMNIGRLEHCIDAARGIWDGRVRAPEPTAGAGRETPGIPGSLSPTASRRTSAAEPGVLGQEEVVFKTVAPGVLAPEERVRSDGLVVLTERGRKQLMLGLRMSSKENIPVIPSERVDKIVMSYESPALVRFWNKVARFLDKQVCRIN